MKSGVARAHFLCTKQLPHKSLTPSNFSRNIPPNCDATHPPAPVTHARHRHRTIRLTADMPSRRFSPDDEEHLLRFLVLA